MKVLAVGLEGEGPQPVAGVVEAAVGCSNPRRMAHCKLMLPGTVNTDIMAVTMAVLAASESHSVLSLDSSSSMSSQACFLSVSWLD